ncbi:MAG: chromosomal replication initiator protein DnaA [Rhodothermales bacterium]
MSLEQSPALVWDRCLDIIRDNISRQSFKTWFEPLRPVRLIEDGGFRKLTVQLPSQFYYEWLEEHYFALIRKTITKVLGSQGRLYYEVVIEKEDMEGQAATSVHLPANAGSHQPPAPSPQPPRVGSVGSPRERSTEFSEFDSGHQTTGSSSTSPFVAPGLVQNKIDSRLNPNYTFDRFIEGDGNRLARSAAWAIAQQPGATSFNPFMVYGGVGLGKTHLNQAIGNHALSHNTARTVLYVSSERFTSEFVQAIQHNRSSDFSMFYRNVDLLIVDDVQFFAGKEKTQEEFFHIFNALHQSGKQIVLSGDRPPREIDGIEERLLSRFQWGLTVDIQPPDLETRIAILQNKAEEDGIQLSHDVTEFIARHVKSNIRELEGSLIRLLAFSSLRQNEITLDLAKEVLRDLIREPQIQLTISDIQRIVCEYFDITEDQIRARTRKREVAQTRQVAMYFCKKLTNNSLKTIGLQFGGRDHSTVIHAYQTVENQIETDKKFSQMIEDVSQRISLRSR